jgi:hypothetical protein
MKNKEKGCSVCSLRHTGAFGTGAQTLAQAAEMSDLELYAQDNHKFWGMSKLSPREAAKCLGNVFERAYERRCLVGIARQWRRDRDVNFVTGVGEVEN